MSGKVVPTKSNDPGGTRPAAAAQGSRAAPPELRELDALLQVLRAHRVASYHRTARGTVTILLFAEAPRPPSDTEEVESEEKRAEALESWERKMKFGAAGGMRGR